MSSDGAVYDIDDKSLADTMTTTKMGDARRGDFGRRRRRRIRRDVHVEGTTSTTTFTVDVIAPPGGGEGITTNAMHEDVDIDVEMIDDNVRRGGGGILIRSRRR